jgi:hypothetical protein
VAVTYAPIARAPRRWARTRLDPSLVIAGEAHHLGEELAWGQGFVTAFGDWVRRRVQ